MSKLKIAKTSPGKINFYNTALVGVLGMWFYYLSYVLKIQTGQNYPIILFLLNHIFALRMIRK